MSFPRTPQSPKPVSGACRGQAGQRPGIVSGVCREERRNLCKLLWFWGSRGHGRRETCLVHKHTPPAHTTLLSTASVKEMSLDHHIHPSPRLYSVRRMAPWVEC